MGPFSAKLQVYRNKKNCKSEISRAPGGEGNKNKESLTAVRRTKLINIYQSGTPCHKFCFDKSNFVILKLKDRAVWMMIGYVVVVFS